MEIGTIVKAYVNIRDALNEERRKFKEAEAELKEQLGVLSSALMEEADRMGVESFKTEYGTAFKTTKDFVNVLDWSTALEFIISDKEHLHMLQKSVSKVAVKEYMAANNNQLPPGLEYGCTVEIQVRR